MDYSYALPFGDVRKCLCAFGTSDGKKMSALATAIKLFSSEAAFLVNSKTETISVFSANHSISITFTEIFKTFFDLLWYVDPRVTSSTATTLPSSSSIHLSHRCLNQSMCVAMQSFISAETFVGGNNSSSTNATTSTIKSALNRNTANCEIRIPIELESFCNRLKSAQDGVYFWVLWDDQTALYIAPYQKPHHHHHHSSGSSSSSFIPRSLSMAACTTTLNSIAILDRNRVYIQRAEIEFSNCYSIPSGRFRKIISEISEAKFENVSFVDNPENSCLYAIGSKVGNVSEFSLHQMPYASPSPSSSSSPPRPPTVGIGFRLDLLNTFTRIKADSTKRVGLMFSEKSVCLETLFERNLPLSSSPNHQQHMPITSLPSARVVFLINNDVTIAKALIQNITHAMIQSRMQEERRRGGGGGVGNNNVNMANAISIAPSSSTPTTEPWKKYTEKEQIEIPGFLTKPHPHWPIWKGWLKQNGGDMSKLDPFVAQSLIQHEMLFGKGSDDDDDDGDIVMCGGGDIDDDENEWE